MSDEHVSGGGGGGDIPNHHREGPWGKVNVRKTMSSPAEFAADESPPEQQREQEQEQYHAGPSHSHSHEHQRHHVHVDGDDDDESEEDGIWFGRRSSSSSVAATDADADADAQADTDADATQSDYDVVTNAMRSVSRVSPLARFRDLDDVFEGEEAERLGSREDDEEEEDEAEDMEMGDSSSSSHSSSSVCSPIGSLTDIKGENERRSGDDALSSSSSPTTTTTTMTSSAMWSLSSGESSSSSSSGISLTPRASTTPSSQSFEARTLPLFNVKLARAVLSGTPRSASPSLDDGTENVEIIAHSPPFKSAEVLPPPALMSSPSSEGSVTPKGEMFSPLELGTSPTGINLNSSSYYSLLNQ